MEVRSLVGVASPKYSLFEISIDLHLCYFFVDALLILIEGVSDFATSYLKFLTSSFLLGLKASAIMVLCTLGSLDVEEKLLISIQ